MTFKENLIIELLKAIPFLIVGLITVYIAYRQYKIEKSKLNKELYQIRLRVYKIIDKIKFLLATRMDVDNELLNKVSFDIEERNFVFSDGLNKKIDELVSDIWRVKESESYENKGESKKLINKVINDSNEIKDKIIVETKIKK